MKYSPFKIKELIKDKAHLLGFSSCRFAKARELEEEENKVSLDDAEKSKEEAPSKVATRKIIRNANLQLETANPTEAQQKAPVL